MSTRDFPPKLSHISPNESRKLPSFEKSENAQSLQKKSNCGSLENQVFTDPSAA